jgi:hypothetical protein
MKKHCLSLKRYGKAVTNVHLSGYFTLEEVGVGFGVSYDTPCSDISS